MKIAMIGASGFVGTRLIGLLKECQAGACGDDPHTSVVPSGGQPKYEIKNIDLLPSHFFNDLTVIGDVRVQEQMDRELEGQDVVVLLAAQHRDDVSPVSLYYDTNVGGMEVTLRAMERNGVKRIVFFSSVAVYGLNKNNPNEEHEKDPFNHYGKSKWQAELVLQEWHKTHPDWCIDIIRPTVIFGERNRGNVYNLLRQISGGKFLMVGKGENRKSMAYVGNIVAFVKWMIDTQINNGDAEGAGQDHTYRSCGGHPHTHKLPSTAVPPLGGGGGYRVFNYIDKPDMNMNQLVAHVSKVLNKHIPATHFPVWLGMLGGYCFDLLAKVTGRKLAISSVRVKKFCATTEFDATKAHASGFKAPYTLADGLARTLEFEFVHSQPADGVTFKSE